MYVSLNAKILIQVAKCHGYDGYIRVKIFASCGKKFGRIINFAKLNPFLGRFTQHVRFAWINKPNLTEKSTCKILRY